MELQPRYNLNMSTEPNNEEYQVVWEKWNDPYGDGAEEEMSNDDDTSDGFNELEENGDIILNDLEDMKKSMLQKPLKIIMTPAGIVPITEYTTPSKIFNFWTGHTNFSITEDIKDIVEHTEGVETLDVFTRYRMKVGIGKIFSSATVMNTITRNLTTYMQSLKNAGTKKA